MAGAATVIVVVIAGLAVAGYFLFTRPHGDPLTPADAIVVLGGEDDGRVQYGMELARQGYAHTVVISSGFLERSPAFHRACASSGPAVTVICFRPDPFTTQGEAKFVQQKATEFGWHHVILVSWNFHMIRARYIFGQCFDGTVTMRPVQTHYNYSLGWWTWIYAYQYGALVKAAVLGC